MTGANDSTTTASGLFTFKTRSLGSSSEGGPVSTCPGPAGPNLGAALEDKEVADKVLQWALRDSLRGVSFRFTGGFENRDEETFLMQLFSCPMVQEALFQRRLEATAVESVEYHELRCGVLSMNFFDRLKNGTICTERGRIRGMFEEVYDDLPVSDHLRELFANENSENRDLYSEEERRELLFKILDFFALGGAMCQPEEELDGYLDTVKIVYKNMVSAFRHSKTGVVQTASHAYSVESLNGDRCLLWQGKGGSSGHNRCLVTVDPKRCLVSILMKEMTPFW